MLIIFEFIFFEIGFFFFRKMDDQLINWLVVFVLKQIKKYTFFEFWCKKIRLVLENRRFERGLFNQNLKSKHDVRKYDFKAGIIKQKLFKCGIFLVRKVSRIIFEILEDLLQQYF
eukprot:TRINITY_DN4658_c1_g2_i2.p1 TRINITY_DN4658_c1_g2~~TRINITY_DN4658_c1_g2_i2.p1  ORF type:complete len:115 (-),score=8.55 TRINITY_DN4658_c1_g2_i2:117-461(-)